MIVNRGREAQLLAEPVATDGTSLAGATCFIERQFPVARVSAESYKERKANYSQTLTGLGKWWGRKPLVLVRATILGLLMPATDDPERDREIFLKLMTMDDEGLWRRKNKAISQKRLLKELRQLPDSLREQYVGSNASADQSRLPRLGREEREALQRLVFERMPYSEKLTYCRRPEHLDGPSAQMWEEINAHLKTCATNLAELVGELGQRRFGQRPRIGDSFCGAGSIPFEAARLGCDGFGSDLNPVAALLSWAALNIVGGSEDVVRHVKEVQRTIFDAVNQQVTDWGIEHNEQGWRADAYLYCVEVRDPESDWLIPLAPSWVIGENTRTVARLVPDERNKRYEIEIHQGVSGNEMQAASKAGTVVNFRLVPPCGAPSTPIDAIARNLRIWEGSDVVPRPEDPFQERLYCVRWVETYYELADNGTVAELPKEEAQSLPRFLELVDGGVLRRKTRRHYRSVTEGDITRERLVAARLAERLASWQQRGCLPSRRIEPGNDINRPMNARGWTYWHHFFNQRQLLINGLFMQAISDADLSPSAKAACLLGVGRVADWNSRECRWDPSPANEKGTQTFYKPSLATPLFNYCCRGFSALETTFCTDVDSCGRQRECRIELCDARTVQERAHLWITDPPYADAVNYHELSEYFLAWYEKSLLDLFPGWYTDSKRAVAIRAEDPMVFRQSMMQCYRRLNQQMPNNGLQVVMFTHQEPSVWADLTMILWAAGLRVTSAWCIATETDSTLKKGNYVQGTVLLVCRKRTSQEGIFLDEVNHRVEAEVRRQLDDMTALEDASEPNFADADYQLAAYAAALRVLTERPIDEIDPEREIVRVRTKGEANPVEQLIRNAVKIACDHLVPKGIDREMWKTLAPMERFYLKGLEVELHGEHRSGVFQELARGFGAADYTDLLAESKANQARLNTASEFGKRMLSGDGFASSLVRQVLFAVQQITRTDETASGLNWLKTELPDYWNARDKIIHILDFLARLDKVAGMDHWGKDAGAARLLAGAVRNDHV